MYETKCLYKYKWQIVDWAVANCGKTKSYWNKMSKNQLFGKYKAHNKKER